MALAMLLCCGYGHSYSVSMGVFAAVLAVVAVKSGLLLRMRLVHSVSAALKSPNLQILYSSWVTTGTCCMANTWPSTHSELAHVCCPSHFPASGGAFIANTGFSRLKNKP